MPEKTDDPMKNRPFRPACLALFWCIAIIPHLASAQSKYILIDGSSTVYPVAKIAAEDFRKRWDNQVQMEVSFSGTSGGFRKFVVGEIDVAGASRPISRAEIKAAKDYKIQFIEIPIAYDALTIAVHPDNTWADQITISDLKKMWEKTAEGKVTKWSQIRPDWPDREIKLYGAGMDSGTYDYFKDVVVGPKGELRSDYTGSEDDDQLIQGIESDAGALGFIPYAYFSKEGGKLKALAVQMDFNAMTGEPVSGALATLPSEDAVHRGIYMPFGRPLFLYVNLKSLEFKPHLKDFLQFFLIHADSYVDGVHYLSLPKIAYARSIADLESKRTGTRFSGVPEIGLSVVDLINRQPR
jgi:phosphate transport system substrate-binding protein